MARKEKGLSVQKRACYERRGMVVSHKVHPRPKLRLLEPFLPLFELEVRVRRVLVGELEVRPELKLGSGADTLEG